MRYLSGLIFVIFFGPFAAFGTTLPIDYFAKSGDYLSVKISPDGSHLASRVRVNGRVMLVVVERESGKVVGGVQPNEDDEVHQFEWVTNDRLIFEFAEKRYYFDSPIPTGELYGVDKSGKNLDVLAGYRAGNAKLGSKLSSRSDSPATFELLSTLEEEEDQVLIVEHPWTQEGRYWYDYRRRPPVVSKMNIFNGRKVKLETLPFKDPTLLADKSGNLRFASWLDETGHFNASIKSVESNQWSALKIAGETYSGLTPIHLNHSSTKVYFIGRYGDNGYRTIYQLSLDSGKLSPIFTELDADIIDWVADSDTGDIVIGTTQRNEYKHHYTDPDNQTVKSHQKLTRSFKGSNLAITNRSKNRRFTILEVFSDVNPGEFYLFDKNTNKADFLLANLSWIDPRDMQPMYNHEVRTRDGTVITARVTLPKTGLNAPVVLMIHGGPHGVYDTWGFDRDVQMLAHQGFAVVQANYRGSGFLGYSFERAGYRQWGDAIIDDIHDALQWSIEEHKLNKENICAYGASFGAYGALMLAARYPGSVKCVIGFAGIYDLEQMFTTGDIPKQWGGTAYLERVLGTDPQVLRQISPVNLADNINADVLLIHGGKDFRAPMVHAEAMKKSLQQHNKSVQWKEFPLNGHGIWNQNTRAEYYNTVIGFIDHHINSDQTP